jgi:hypothetical protein
MANEFDRIDGNLRAWIERQSMFFVATAPLARDGHVNLSPKGPIGSLAILDEHTVAYLDVNGSGVETIGHLRENGRITIMFCAFEGRPRILRLHGRGEPILAGDARFDRLLAQAPFEDLSLPQARRAIIRVEVARIADSCGYGVPLMSFEGMREHHALSATKKLRVQGEEGYRDGQLERGAVTIDGLPALR